MDPFQNFKYQLEIDKVAVAGFHECLSDLPQVGHDTTYNEIPGQTKFLNIVLERGVFYDNDLYTWYREAVEGHPNRRDGSVILFDRQGVEVARWDIFDAWPTKYAGSSLTAEGNEVADGSLELALGGLVFVI